jgi:hypothetical protein
MNLVCNILWPLENLEPMSGIYLSTTAKDDESNWVIGNWEKVNFIAHFILGVALFLCELRGTFRDVFV